MTAFADPGLAVGATTTPYLSARRMPGAAVRLLCFHHAGGAAPPYGGWQDALGPGVEVLPVQLPGRERRVREAPHHDMATLVAELDEHLDPVLDRPYVLYGHSMGALVAHELAARRQARGRSTPDRLLVGACSPVDVHLPRALSAMTDEGLTEWMLSTGGMSREVLRYPEWRQSALALVRADLHLCISCRIPEHEPLRCPVDAFAGASDPLVGPAEMARWGEFTSGRTSVQSVPGGHLFLHEAPNTFFPILRRVLDSAVRVAL